MILKETFLRPDLDEKKLSFVFAQLWAKEISLDQKIKDIVEG